MTRPHCDHECVCYLFLQNCFVGKSPCQEPCKDDTRSKTPAPAASEIKTCFDLKEYGESIRNQTLDEVLKRLEKQGVEIHERNGQRYYVVEGTFNFASFMKWLESLRTQEHERK